MQRYVASAQFIAVLWIIGTVCTGSSFANGGPEAPFYKEAAAVSGFDTPTTLMIAIFCGTVPIKYLVIVGFLRGSTKDWLKLFLWVLLVNIITNPATQYAMLCTAHPQLVEFDTFWIEIFMIELVAVLVEFYLLILIFERMYRRGTLDAPVTARRAFLITLVANVASFMFTPAWLSIGLLGYGLVAYFIVVGRMIYRERMAA